MIKLERPLCVYIENNKLCLSSKASNGQEYALGVIVEPGMTIDKFDLHLQMLKRAFDWTELTLND